MNPEDIEILMVKTVDGLATPAERDALMRVLSDQPEWAEEFETQQALKALTDGWVKRLEADLLEDSFENSRLSKAENGLGWTLFLVGYSVLIAGSIASMWVDPDVPVWARWGTGLLVSGLLTLLASAIRWKWKTSKKDPYKEVIR